MNNIQQHYNLPFIVQSETKPEYIQALIETREQENISIFRKFMQQEYSKQRNQEITNFEEGLQPKKGKRFHILF